MSGPSHEAPTAPPSDVGSHATESTAAGSGTNPDSGSWVDRVRQRVGTKILGKQSQDAPPPPEKHTIDRGRELISGVTTEQGPDVKVNQETVTQYKNVLDSYVSQIARLSDAEIAAMKADPKYAFDMKLLDELTKETYANGAVVGREVNADKLTDFLKHRDNWALTTMMMEQYALQTEMALSWQASIFSKYDKHQKPGHLDLEGDDELSRRFTIPSSLKRFGIGIKKAGAVGAFVVGASGVTKIDYSTDASILRGLKTNATAADKAYLRTVVGIDIDKISIGTRLNKGGYVKDVIEYTDGDKPNLEVLQKRTTNLYKAREAFLADLGVDPSTIRLPEEFIVDNNAESEGLMARYYKEIITEYGNLGGNTNRKDINLRRMAEARSKVMLRYVERRITEGKAESEKTKDKKTLTALKAKRDAMGPNYREERKAEHTKVITDAEEAKGKVKTKKDALTTGEKAIIAKTTELNSIQDQLVEYDIPLDGDIPAAIKGKLNGIQGEIDNLQTEYEDKKDAKAGALRPYIDDILKTQREISGQGGTQQGTTSGAEGQQNQPVKLQVDLSPITSLVERTLNNQYDSKIATEQAKVEKKQAEYDKLKGLLDSYKATLRARNDASKELASQENQLIDNTNQAYDDFTTGATPLCTIPEMQTLTVSELRDRLTTGTDEEKLEKALRAKTEAKARQGETARPIAAHLLTSFTDVTSRGITLNELLTSDASNLYTRLKASGMPDSEINKNITNATLVAERRFRDRYTTILDTETEYYDDVIKTEKDLLENLSDFKEARMEVEVAVQAMESQEQDKIYGKMKEAEGNPAERAKYSPNGTALVDINDTTYSTAERNSGLPLWVIKWFHTVNPEAVLADNRDELFEAFTRSLGEPPQDKLRALLSDQTSPNIIKPLLPLRRASRNVINYLRDHAAAV